MGLKSNFTTLVVIQSTSSGGLLNRMDFISVIILGILLLICSLICCYFGFKRRKILPNDTQMVDIPISNEAEESFGAELRYPERNRASHISIRAPRAPDSPPPTYSVLERQTSFTSYVSQMSSQIEIPPGYEEAAGTARESLMATLIPEEEGPIISTSTIGGRECSYRKSESEKYKPPSHISRTSRSKSDVGRRKQRYENSSKTGKTSFDATTTVSESPQSLLRKPQNPAQSRNPVLIPSNVVSSHNLTPATSSEMSNSLMAENHGTGSHGHCASSRFSKAEPVVSRASTDV